MIRKWWRPSQDAQRRGDRPRPFQPITPAEYRRFEEYSRALAALWLPRVAAFFAVVIVAFWPLDAVIDDGHPGTARALLELRIGTLVLMLALLAVATFTDWVARSPRLFAIGGLLAGIFTLGWTVAPAGDLSHPWFHYMTTIAFLSVVAPMRLGERIAVALACSAAVFAGYFLREPSYLDHPFLGSTIGQLLFGAALAVAIGHQIRVLMVRADVRRGRLAAKQAELEGLSASLEARVEEQTRDLSALAHHLDAGVAEERKLLAREIHDRLGQELTALGYAVASARKRAEQGPAGVQVAVGEADRLLTRTRETLRRIVARLGPQVLEQLGFAGAVRWAVDDLAGRAGLATHLRCPPDAALDEAVDPERARATFQALGEALNNVVRHAGASTVTVQLAPEDGRLHLAVVDDGVGPGESPEAVGHGLGLIALRERARALGGEARWGRGDDGGFALRMSLPLAAPEEAP